MVKLFLLATAVLIPKFKFLLCLVCFFFFCFQLCFLFHLSMHQSIPVSSLIIFRAECWPFLRSVIPWVGHLQILMQPGDWAFANHGGPGHPWALHTIMEPKYS